MRYLSKSFVIVVGLLAIGLLSSSVRANDLLAGTFKLTNPTQWNNTVLPAGNYTFRMARTQTDMNMLLIRGAKQTLDLVIFAQSACETCRSGALSVAVQGDNRVVTSLELPGFHMIYKVRQSAAQRGEELAKTPAPSEQVAVHVDPN
jgi:hypothetical protein